MSVGRDLERRLQAIVEAEAAVEGTATILRVELPRRGFVWSGVAGGITRGGPPASAGSTFRIASITKTFTAAVILQLVAASRLRLDDPMHEHLPVTQADLVDRVHVLDGVSYGREISIRRLLDHSSGLFDYASCRQFGEALVADPSRPWTPRRLVEGAIAWGAPNFPPGGGYGYAYNDTGYVLLGMIIEHVDGRPLHEAYRARILDPLAMGETSLEGYEPHRGPPMTHCYEGELDASAIHGSADWAGGGLVSTAADLAVFAQALLRGDIVGEPELGEMLEWRFRALEPQRHTPGYLGYALGVDARESNGMILRGHRGHWGVLTHIDPHSGLTITGTINQAKRRPDPMMHAVTAAVVEGGGVGR